MSNKVRGGEITFELYNNNKFRSKKHFYYITNIKKALLKHNLETKGSKKELEKCLFDFYDSLNLYKNNIKQILFIQDRIKKKQNRFRIKMQGIGIICKDKCVNQEDFYTLENINELEDKYFFSYEQNKYIYFFDIRSFKKLLETTNKNPYTLIKIPQYAIESFNLRQESLKNNNINIIFEDTIKLTKEQKFNNNVLSVFQKIDMLNVAASGVDLNWFHNLNSIQLKMYYKLLEDIWNYRAELTIQHKLQIVPTNDMFQISVHQVYSINNMDKRKLQKIVLNEIDKLISSAQSNEHRMTGCYYVLTALVEISPQCAQALPWLIQYNPI